MFIKTLYILVLILPWFLQKPTILSVALNIGLFHNKQVQIYKEENMLIYSEKIDKEGINIELLSSTYIIESFFYPGGSKDFQKSNNLQEVAKSLGISNPETIPLKSGLYIVSKGIFIESGVTTLNLVVTTLSDNNEIASVKYNITVTTKPSFCLPKIRGCSSDPHQPRRLPLERTNRIRLIVERNCGPGSTLSYHWSIRDYLDLIEMNKFSDKNMELTVPAYSLWFNDVNKQFHGMYVIRLQVDEHGIDVGLSGYGIIRCYVSVAIKPPIPIIIGGSLREINVNKPFILDASISIDQSTGKTMETLEFLWSCSSDDAQNKLCKSDFRKGPVITIQKKMLKTNYTYKFTVAVKSTKTFQTEQALQNIIPTFEDRLTISLNCIRNCKNDLFTREIKVHLLANCQDCDGTPKFVWSLIKPKNVNLSQKARLIVDASLLVNDDSSDPTSEVEVNVTDNNLKGFARLTLTLTPPPNVGSCTFNPAEGEELTTLFVIICSNFGVPLQQLTYTLYQGEQMLYSHMQNEFELKLRANEESASVLKIVVTDKHEGYSTYELKIPLKKINIEPNLNSIIAFLYETGKIEELISMTDTPSIINYLYKAMDCVEEIKNETEKILVVEKVMEIQSHITMSTIDDVQILVINFQSAANILPTNNEIAAHSSPIFNKMTDLMGKIATSDEHIDISTSEYKNMTRALLDTSEKLLEMVDTFPMVHDAELPRPEDPLEENYPDYGEFDFSIIEKIYNWEIAADSSQNLFETIGAVASRLYYPGESDLTESKLNSSWRFEAFAPEEIHNFTIYGENEIFISEELIKHLHSSRSQKKVGIQIMQLKRNPFWWCPEQFKVNSRIINLTPYAEVEKLNEFLKSSFSDEHNFEILLKRDGTEPQQTFVTKGKVKTDLDMPIYEFNLPQNGIAYFKFSSVEGTIVVYYSIQNFPKYRQVLANGTKIQNSSYSIEVINTEGRDVIAYVAILAHNSSNPPINFLLETSVYSCQSWDRNTSKWCTRYCRVGLRTNSTHIHCQCNHFSYFGSKYYIVPNEIKLPRDVILELKKNILFIVVYTVSILLFIILLIWAGIRDIKDHDKANIIYLDKPEENPHQYYMTVKTGNQPYAGTTANIFIQLIGTKGKSNRYNLAVVYFEKALTRGSEQTYFMSTPQHLGTILFIELENDYTGRYPSWYCKLIRIKDDTKKEEYLFMISKWLSLVYNNVITIQVKPPTKGDILNFKFILWEHYKRLFTEGYPLYNLTTVHPCSVLRRIEKAAILFLVISVGWMISMMLFERTTLDNVEEERVRYKTVALFMNQLFKIFLSIFIGLSLSLFVAAMFRKAKGLPNESYDLVVSK